MPYLLSYRFLKCNKKFLYLRAWSQRFGGTSFQADYWNFRLQFWNLDYKMGEKMQKINIWGPLIVRESTNFWGVIVEKNRKSKVNFLLSRIACFSKKENKNEYQDCFPESYNNKTITIYFFVNRPKHYRFGGLA